MTFDIWANGKRKTAPVVKLPDYPANAGPGTAKQVENRADHYRKVAAELRRELAAVEDAMVSALDRQEARQGAADRIHRIAKGRPR
ncbi:MAG: hypothetical protein BGO95_11685 [Micrococcales bacterium 73-13]|nr:MAG: hypothetical protein BGO95_11685 [Micrococcales bacterium 73-13]